MSDSVGELVMTILSVLFAIIVAMV